MDLTVANHTTDKRTKNRKYVILVDAREKRPLPIPQNLVILDPAGPPVAQRTVIVEIIVKEKTLETADYVLQDYKADVYLTGQAAVVERKASVDEIHTNVFNSMRRERFVGMLSRMKSTWVFPTLLLEGGLQKFYEPTFRVPTPGLVMDALMRLCYEHGVQLQLAHGHTSKQRRIIGEHVTRLLINGELSHVGFTNHPG